MNPDFVESTVLPDGPIGTNVSSTITGTQVTLRATTVNTLFGANATLLSTLTFTGLDSGARITIPITITKSTT